MPPTTSSKQLVQNGDSVDGRNSHPFKQVTSTTNQTSSTDTAMSAQVASNQVPPTSQISQPFQPPVLDMKKEVDRYTTFTSLNWPGCVSERDLARAGFYYYGRDDHVRCAFCENDVGMWEEGDEPLQEHKRHFPFCRFIRGIDVGNVPRPGTDNPVAYAPDEAGHDICGIRPMVRPYSAPEQSVLPKGSTVKEGADLKKLGVVKTHVPTTPHLATKEARMQTYKLWPRGLKQKPSVLADAGFYYTGTGDRVKCFHCDGGLADWEDDDDPWEEHARWFSRCSFVLQMHGQKFVDEAIRKKQPVLGPQEESSASGVTDAEEMDVDVQQNAEVTNTSENSKPGSALDNDGEVRICRVCLEEERGMVFLPCGHFVCCVKCGPLLSKCPVCRQGIEASVRTFLS